MKILITSPRAPIVIEWIRIMQDSGHDVAVVDSLDYPIARFCKNVVYIKIPSPRLEFAAYQVAMHKLLDQYDFVIPTCEDIFYLSLATENDSRRNKIFMPANELLFGLHSKYKFSEYMNKHVKVPKTRYCTKKEDIEIISETLLKPVYSRFGRSIIREVNKKNVERMDISATYPWVQQEFVHGDPLCNYAIIDNGRVVAHVSYRPRYLLNDAASTYFEYVYDERCERFINQFAKDTHYHGQVAFDFIDDGKDLYVLECNPRATSGLHLISRSVAYSDRKFEKTSNHVEQCCSVGKSLYLLFGFKALLSGELATLHRDYKRSKDVLVGLPIRAQVLPFYEMIKRAIIYRMPLTTASTFDIEYDG